VNDRALRVSVVAAALAGAAVSSYLLVSRLAHSTIVCTTGGCETVQSSRYSELLGVPVAALGLAAYLAVLASALSGHDLARAAGAAIALGGVGFGAYLLYVQLVEIGAVCSWCVTTDALFTGLAAVCVLRLVRGARGVSPA
jgi:uncharacterized membrane protein